MRIVMGYGGEGHGVWRVREGGVATSCQAGRCDGARPGRRTCHSCGHRYNGVHHA